MSHFNYVETEFRDTATLLLALKRFGFRASSINIHGHAKQEITSYQERLGELNEWKEGHDSRLQNGEVAISFKFDQFPDFAECLGKDEPQICYGYDDKPRKDDNGDHVIADIVIHRADVGASSNDLGFKWDGEKYVMIRSDYDTSSYQSKISEIHNATKRLKGDYGAAQAILFAASQGGVVCQEVNPETGRIRYAIKGRKTRQDAVVSRAKAVSRR